MFFIFILIIGLVKSYTTQQYQIQCQSTSGSPTFTVGSTHVSTTTLTIPGGSQCVTIHYLNQLLAPSSSAQLFPYVPLVVKKNSVAVSTIIADASGIAFNNTNPTRGNPSTIYFSDTDVITVEFGSGLTTCGDLNIVVLGSATLGTVTFSFSSTCSDPALQVGVIGKLEGITNTVTIGGSVSVSNAVTISEIQANISGISSAIQVSSVNAPISLNGNLTAITQVVTVQNANTVPLLTSNIYVISNQAQFTGGLCVDYALSNNKWVFIEPIYSISFNPYLLSIGGVNYLVMNNGIVYPSIPPQKYLGISVSTGDTAIQICVIANSQLSSNTNLLAIISKI